MNKEEIVALLNSVASPVCQIEAELGMPKTTLQKAIKGQRKLPKKWAIKLIERYGALRVISPKQDKIIGQPAPASPEPVSDIDKMFEEELQKIKNKTK